MGNQPLGLENLK